MHRQCALRVLVVDDESVISQTLAAILRQHGFAATSFTNPLDALKSAMAEPPDLLISDVNMPQLSGVDLAVRVKTRFPQCKILLFSGQATTSDLLRTTREQGHDFQLLSKPVHPTDLLREIDNLADGEYVPEVYGNSVICLSP